MDSGFCDFRLYGNILIVFDETAVFAYNHPLTSELWFFPAGDVIIDYAVDFKSNTVKLALLEGDNIEIDIFTGNGIRLC